MDRSNDYSFSDAELAAFRDLRRQNSDFIDTVFPLSLDMKAMRDVFRAPSSEGIPSLTIEGVVRAIP